MHIFTKLTKNISLMQLTHLLTFSSEDKQETRPPTTVATIPQSTTPNTNEGIHNLVKVEKTNSL